MATPGPPQGVDMTPASPENKETEGYRFSSDDEILALKARCEKAETALARSEKFYSQIVKRGLRLTSENSMLKNKLVLAKKEIAQLAHSSPGSTSTARPALTTPVSPNNSLASSTRHRQEVSGKQQNRPVQKIVIPINDKLITCLTEAVDKRNTGAMQHTIATPHEHRILIDQKLISEDKKARREQTKTHHSKASVPRFGIPIDSKLIAAVTKTHRKQSRTLHSKANLHRFGIPIDDKLIAAVTGGTGKVIPTQERSYASRHYIRIDDKLIAALVERNHAAKESEEQIEPMPRSNTIENDNPTFTAKQPDDEVKSKKQSSEKEKQDKIRTALEQRIVRLHSAHTLHRCVRQWVKRIRHKKIETARAAEDAIAIENEHAATKLLAEQKAMRMKLITATKMQSDQLRQATETLASMKLDNKRLTKKLKRLQRAFELSKSNEEYLLNLYTIEMAAWKIQSFVRRHYRRHSNAGVNRELRKALYDTIHRAQEQFHKGIQDKQNGSEASVSEEHFYTYSVDEVRDAAGSLACAECGSTVRALKMDVEDDGEADLYCEPCWKDFYGHSFSKHDHMLQNVIDGKDERFLAWPIL